MNHHLSRPVKHRLLLAVTALAATLLSSGQAADAPADAWKIGAPIVTYWAGPGFPGGGPLNDAAATQMKEGGWNLVWCGEKELDTAQRHGLRGLLTDPLLNPATLDDPKKLGELDALVRRVQKHTALYAYHLVDEPRAAAFPALGKLVAHLRELDPGHLAYINLLPTYANNEQLGTKGNTVESYTEHLRQYVETVRPALLSYDHYQFIESADNPDYFLNLALIRGKAQATGLPFMNIVQASSWVPASQASPSSPRVPNGDEMRYLVYTTLAYGAQAISYYVYCYPEHRGGIARADGTTTPLYDALKPLNHEFTAIARELQPLKSLGVWHAGMLPPGAEPIPKDSAFAFDPPVPHMEYKSGDRVQGLLLSQFGPADGANAAGTHVLMVNLDYKNERAVALNGPKPFEIFDAATGQWTATGGARAELRLPGGGGKLLRLHP